MLTLEFVQNKSANRLKKLHPVVKEATEALIQLSHAAGIPILIAQGLRTIEEQNALYEQGRTKPGNIVTNARGGYSYHNFGVAIDFCILKDSGKDVSWTVDNRWMKVVSFAKQLGFEWGGDWTSFKDYPHFEMTFSLSCAQYRSGIQPNTSRLEAALKRIRDAKGEEDDMKITELEKIVKEQDKRIKELEAKACIPEPPEWALEACVAAKKVEALNTSNNGSYDFYRFVTMMHRAGLFKDKQIDNISEK